MTGRTVSFLSPTGKHFEEETGEPGGVFRKPLLYNPQQGLGLSGDIPKCKGQID